MKRLLTVHCLLALAAAALLASPCAAQLIGGQNETSENCNAAFVVGPWTPTPGTIFAGPAGPHILISEVAVTPTGSEFIEICNPTGITINLNDTYLSDDWFDGPPKVGYFRLPVAGYTLGAITTDFNMRFPASAIILPGQRLVIAVDGAAFMAAFAGIVPNYEINPTSAVPDMIDVGGNAPRSTALLTNTSEPVVLYHWDGSSDNVCDNDYVTWGAATTSSRVDKTGTATDGPDGDAIATPYLPDTPSGAQIAAVAPGAAQSIARQGCVELGEAPGPGNGCIPGATPVRISTWGSLKARYR